MTNPFKGMNVGTLSFVDEANMAMAFQANGSLSGMPFDMDCPVLTHVATGKKYVGFGIGWPKVAQSDNTPVSRDDIVIKMADAIDLTNQLISTKDWSFDMATYHTLVKGDTIDFTFDMGGITLGMEI